MTAALLLLSLSRWVSGLMDRDYPVAARDIAAGREVRGTLRGRGDVDYERLVVEKDSLVFVSFSSTQEVWIRAETREGRVLKEAWGKEGDAWFKAKKGEVFLRLYNLGEGKTRYRLRTSVLTDGADPSDSPGEAPPVVSPERGVVCGWEDEDWFSLEGGWVYEADLEGEDVFFDVYEGEKRVPVSPKGRFALSGWGKLVVRTADRHPARYCLKVERLAPAKVDLGTLRPGEWREVKLLPPYSVVSFYAKLEAGGRVQVVSLSRVPISLKWEGGENEGMSFNLLFFPFTGRVKFEVGCPFPVDEVRLFVGVSDLN